jgi:transposase
MSLEKKRRFAEAVKNGKPIDKDLYRELSISRSTAYAWLNDFRSTGDAWWQPKRGPRHSMIDKGDIKWSSKIIEAFALQHPEWGCDKILDHLNEWGLYLSSPAVQKHLIKLGLSDQRVRYQRSGRAVRASEVCPAEEISWLERALKERPLVPRGTSPGEILIQDSCITGSTLSDLFFSAELIIDTFDSRTFCTIGGGAGRQIRAIELTMDEFKKKGIKVSKVFTDCSQHYGHGQSGHPYHDFLQQHGIAHALVGERGVTPTQTEIVRNAWRTIRTQFLLPRRDEFIAGEVAPVDIEYDLAIWLENDFAKIHTRREGSRNSGNSSK